MEVAADTEWQIARTGSEDLEVVLGVVHSSAVGMHLAAVMLGSTRSPGPREVHPAAG